MAVRWTVFTTFPSPFRLGPCWSIIGLCTKRLAPTSLHGYIGLGSDLSFVLVQKSPLPGFRGTEVILLFLYGRKIWHTRSRIIKQSLNLGPLSQPPDYAPCRTRFLPELLGPCLRHPSTPSPICQSAGGTGTLVDSCANISSDHLGM